MRSGRCGRGTEKQGIAPRNCAKRKKFGIETLDYLIEQREEYDEDFRRGLCSSGNIHYHLAADEKRGIAKFSEIVAEAQSRHCVFEPKFV